MEPIEGKEINSDQTLVRIIEKKFQNTQIDNSVFLLISYLTIYSRNHLFFVQDHICMICKADYRIEQPRRMNKSEQLSGQG